MMGRVVEQAWKDQHLKSERKAFDPNDVGKDALALGQLEDIAALGGAEKDMRKKGKRGRKRRVEEDSGLASGKRRKDEEE